jgi:hypothetical protein
LKRFREKSSSKRESNCDPNQRIHGKSSENEEVDPSQAPVKARNEYNVQRHEWDLEYEETWKDPT